MKRQRTFSAMILATSVSLMAASAYAQTIWVVDGDGHASATNCNASTAAMTSIQAALNAAAPGDTVLVCPGTYDEQLTVSKAGLTLRGSGAANTLIRPGTVAVNTTSAVLGTPF